MLHSARRDVSHGGRGDDHSNARRAEEAAAAMAAAMDQEHVFGSVELGQQWAEHAAAWERFSAHPPDDITVRMRMRTAYPPTTPPQPAPSQPERVLYCNIFRRSHLHT